MKYNHVSIPAARGYDKSAYPCACIADSTLLPGVYTMYICSEPFYFSAEEQNVRAIAGCRLSASKLTDGVWSEWDVIDRFAGTTGFLPFWCDADILFENGAVYLEGTQPRREAPEIREHFRVRNWLVNFAVGLAGKPLPTVGRHR